MRSVILAATLSAAALASPAAADCKLGKIAELKATMTGLQPLVTAKINGQEAQFLVDSGAFYSLITPAAARQYGLKTYAAPGGLVVRGVGGSARTQATTVKTFTLADVPIQDLEFLVAEAGGGGAGLIGQNVLRLRDVEYDLANGVIRLFEPRGCDRVNLAYWAKDQTVAELPIETGDSRVSPFTIGTVMINGKPILALFDTGAGISSMTLPSAAYAGIKPDSPGVVRLGVASGIGRAVARTWSAPVDKVQIGGETLTHTKMEVGDYSLGREGMLIGADFFLSHRVYVSNSQHRMYFTYNGGPIFRLAAAPVLKPAPGEPAAAPAADQPATAAVAAAAPDAPSDADGFSRRGAGYLARRDYERAAADFTRAIELAPGEARYLYQRAVARGGLRQAFLAMADLDAALKLKPDDLQTLLLRAELRRAGHDGAGERADLDAIDAHAPKQADLRLQLAALYLGSDLFEPAIRNFTDWLADHGEDARAPQALAGRCRARALAGVELKAAMDDCNAALRDRPKYSAALESRGLLRLRAGDFDRAMEDFNAALTLSPKAVWALYGRAQVRLHKGQSAEGEADLAAALALAPRVDDRAARFGLAGAPSSLRPLPIPPPPSQTAPAAAGAAHP